jgi:hypothetical protein
MCIRDGIPRRSAGWINQHWMTSAVKINLWEELFLSLRQWNECLCIVCGIMETIEIHRMQICLTCGLGRIFLELIVSKLLIDQTRHFFMKQNKQILYIISGEQTKFLKQAWFCSSGK